MKKQKKKTNLKPLQDFVIIEDYGEFVPASPIIILGTFNKFPVRFGVVIAVGPGRHTSKGEFVKTTSKIGDIVMYDRRNGSMVTEETRAQLRSEGDMPLRILDERRQLLAKIEDPDEGVKQRMEFVKYGEGHKPM